MGSSLPRPWGGHSGSYLSHAVQKTKQQLVMMMMRECCQVWELLSTKNGSPTVTSSSTAGARAECLIPNQKAQCSLRNSLGTPGTALALHGAAGWESQGLGSALLGGWLSPHHLSSPKPHHHLGIWVAAEGGAKAGVYLFVILLCYTSTTTTFFRA